MLASVKSVRGMMTVRPDILSVTTAFVPATMALYLPSAAWLAKVQHLLCNAIFVKRHGRKEKTN